MFRGKQREGTNLLMIYLIPVMMGEICDEESVDALMRLSSSGHRAISTLHTNSVCDVPKRFFLFRAQPFMVADSLKMAISQRLVKKVCPRCYIEEPVPSIVPKAEALTTKTAKIITQVMIGRQVSCLPLNQDD